MWACLCHQVETSFLTTEKFAIAVHITRDTKGRSAKLLHRENSGGQKAIHGDAMSEILI